MLELLVAAIGGYLLGSIPFGLVLTRMAGLGDIRQIGSGTITLSMGLILGSRHWRKVGCWVTRLPVSKRRPI